MEGIKKLPGAYLIGTATVVAVWFIINTFFVDSFEVLNVWYVLDIVMLVGLLWHWYSTTTGSGKRRLGAVRKRQSHGDILKSTLLST